MTCGGGGDALASAADTAMRCRLLPPADWCSESASIRPTCRTGHTSESAILTTECVIEGNTKHWHHASYTAAN